METGVELIAKERQEQISKHSRTEERDIKENAGGQLQAAALYILAMDYNENAEDYYPEDWSEEFQLSLEKKTQKERLVIAGALIAAEIDRQTQKQ